MCGVAWFVLGAYGFWGIVFAWAPSALCITLLTVAWALFAAAVICAIVAGTPTKKELKKRKKARQLKHA